MEYIQGESLEHLWSRLAIPERKAIAAQPRKAISSLREVPHFGYFESIGNSKLRDGMFWTVESQQNINGPFSTESELIDGMILRYIQDCVDIVLHKAEYYRRVLPKALRGSDKPVFTHNDFNRKISPFGRTAL